MAIHQPEIYYFDDDGLIPNSRLPVLLFRNVHPENEQITADFLEQNFASNQWTNSWRWGIYPFHHYHSNTHEVLGIFQGEATLQLGGENGKKIDVQIGDVIIIPAGVGHKCLKHQNGFQVVGAYPNGAEPDLNKCKEGERPRADQNIAQVALPALDPLCGKQGGLNSYWKN